MNGLVEKFGLDYKLLLSQAANFMLLLIVLRLLLYKPLLRFMEERKRKIEEGITKANEADKRLLEIANIKVEKIKEAEITGLGIIESAEKTARAAEKNILAQAEHKEEEIMRRAREQAENISKQEFGKIEKEAAHLVRQILEKTVEMSPEAIDDALLEKALREVKIAK